MHYIDYCILEAHVGLLFVYCVVVVVVVVVVVDVVVVAVVVVGVVVVLKAAVPFL